MYKKRSIAPMLAQALHAMPVVVLTGPRQAGKSTILRSDPSFGARRYFTLDDVTTLARALREPDSLLEGDEPVTIDEAQRAPGLMLAIKRAVDQKRINGQFLLSGSANFLLLKNLAESLAGRAVYLRLGPMTWHEQNDTGVEPALVRLLRSEGHIAETIENVRPFQNPTPADWIAGGLPPVCLDRGIETWRLWFTGYRQTYLERDLRDLSHVADLGLFEQFIQIMALRSAQVLNLRDVARDCGSNAPTVARWIRLLETGFIGQRLAPYFSNRVKRLVKAPKWYIADSGLMGFLAGLDPSMTIDSHPMRGPLFETYLMQNLSSLLGDFLPDARMLHYRSHAGHEVDFVVETARQVVAIEAKAGMDVDARDVKGLVEFVRSEPRCVAGVVAYNGSQVRALDNKLWAVPTGLLIG